MSRRGRGQAAATEEPTTDGEGEQPEADVEGDEATEAATEEPTTDGAKDGAVAPMRIRFEHCVMLSTRKFQRHHTSHGEVMLANDLAPETLDEVLSKGWAKQIEGDEEDAGGE